MSDKQNEKRKTALQQERAEKWVFSQWRQIIQNLCKNNRLEFARVQARSHKKLSKGRSKSETDPIVN